MKIMMRTAEDDFVAFKTAEAMESLGANVFSISYNGQDTHYGALAPHSRYIVWAKVDDSADQGFFDAIDAAISKALDDT